MRWLTVKPEPREGQVRMRSAFAWLPTKVGQHTVWLEFFGVWEIYGVDGYPRSGWQETRREVLEYYG